MLMYQINVDWCCKSSNIFGHIYNVDILYCKCATDRRYYATDSQITKRKRLTKRLQQSLTCTSHCIEITQFYQMHPASFHTLRMLRFNLLFSNKELK